jgi:hypothetical protein
MYCREDEGEEGVRKGKELKERERAFKKRSQVGGNVREFDSIKFILMMSGIELYNVRV